MKTRIITSIIGLIVIIPFFVFFHTYAGTALMQILGILSIYELSSAVNMKTKFVSTVPLYLAAAGIPLLIFFESTREDFFKYCAMIFFVIAVYMLTAAVFSKGKIKVDDTAVLFTMCFYAVISFNSIYSLRHESKGEFLYLLPFCASWMTDIFAYFSGRLFGRHKLIPDVSPKKTVEGAIGGFLISVLSTVLYGFLVGCFSDAKPQYLFLIIAGALMSAASMAGDLIASLVKRHYGVKDYGWILPGHGGVLDRFDSVLAAAPVLFILYELPGFSLFV